jgi:sentrin-specific protease 1
VRDVFENGNDDSRMAAQLHASLQLAEHHEHGLDELSDVPPRQLFTAAPPTTPGSAVHEALRFASAPAPPSTPVPKSRAELEARASLLRQRFTPKPSASTASRGAHAPHSQLSLPAPLQLDATPVATRVVPKSLAALANESTPFKAAVQTSALLTSRGAPTPIFDSLISNRVEQSRRMRTDATAAPTTPAAEASASFWTAKQHAPSALAERHQATRADIVEQERVMDEARAARKAQLLAEAMRDELLRQRVEAHRKAVVAANARNSAARTLTDDERRLVENAMDADDDEFVTEVGGCEINGRDARRFSDGGWLNDEGVNAYMSYLKKHAALDRESFFNVHAFNSFFYELLSSKGRGYDYGRVASWTRKIDVFALDKVLVPVHLGNHWCLAVINVAARRIEYYDSFGHDNPDCMHILHRYLADEHLHKKKAPLPDADQWSDVTPSNHPQQKNTYDCGMFMLEFARYSAMRVGDAKALPRFPFSQADIPECRRRALLELIEANERAPTHSDNDDDDLDD